MSTGIPQQAPTNVLDFEQLKAQLGQMLANHAPAAPVIYGAPYQAPAQWAPPQPAMMPAGAMMMQPQPATGTGLLVPVGLTLPNGSELTVYLQLGPEAAQNPMGAVISLINSQAPVKTYPKKQQDSGNGNKWGNQGGGNNNSYNGGRR